MVGEHKDPNAAILRMELLESMYARRESWILVPVSSYPCLEGICEDMIH